MRRRALLGTVGFAAATAGCLRFTNSGGGDTTRTDGTADAATAAPDGNVETAPPATDATERSGSTAGGVAIAYDRSDGTERWRFEAPTDGNHHRTDPLAAQDELVFVGSQDHGSGDDQEPLVFALDAETGETRYVVDDLPATFISGLFVHDATLYVATVRGELVGYAMDDGARETTLSIPGSFGGPTPVGDTVYFPGSRTTALDLSSRARQWGTELPATAVTRPVVSDDTVFVGTRAGHVAALARDTGEILWQMRTAAEVGSLSAGSTVVWASDDGGRIYGYDVADGTERYRQPSDRQSNRPVAAVDDLLCVGRPTFEIARIEGRDGESLALTEAWSMDRGVADVWARDGRFYADSGGIQAFGPDGPTGPTFDRSARALWPRAFRLTDSLALVGTQADDE
jgi:outer membrane protein assembly factor BamB